RHAIVWWQRGGPRMARRDPPDPLQVARAVEPRERGLEARELVELADAARQDKAVVRVEVGAMGAPRPDLVGEREGVLAHHEPRRGGRGRRRRARGRARAAHQEREEYAEHPAPPARWTGGADRGRITGLAVRGARPDHPWTE